MKISLTTFAAFFLGFALLAGSIDANDRRVVTFKDRTIDLRPYVEGFPYSDFTPFYAANKLYYYHQDSTTMLKQVELSGEVDLRNGMAISDLDFSKRNVWGIRYREADARLYWIGDEFNDEIINIYRLNPVTQDIKKLTGVPYIFGWQWDEPEQQIAYVARLGDKDERLGELRLLSLDSLKETKIVQDVPALRFTWGTPSWQPEGKGVVISALKDAQREYGNLVYVDLQSREWRLLTDSSKVRNFCSADDEWLSSDEFLYQSNEDGYYNLYRYNLTTNTSSQLTAFEKDLSDSELVTIDGKTYVFVVLSNPIESEVFLIEPQTGKIVQQQKVDANLTLLDNEGQKIMLSSTSATSKFRIAELTVSPDQLTFETKIDLPPDLKEKIVHTRVERIEYPTFDTDPSTGKPRMLHAFLYHPQNPLPKEEQMVMIKSFYGGNNRYRTSTQILGEAGIYVLSPAPRGSRGFGRAFASLNDKDLGGNEIIDIIYAGKYISEKLDIPPDRIGVFGGSHGGYATMRLLTFPGEINGYRTRFDWGFGISHAGFSDIIHFYEHCNIPDWVLLEAGDPQSEQEKLRDRSPLYHADKMTGKLLLTHGANDRRVPIAGSRAMADSLRKYGKEFTLVEFPDQGHSIKGLENNIRYYQAWFEFLESIE